MFQNCILEDKVEVAMQFLDSLTKFDLDAGVKFSTSEKTMIEERRVIIRKHLSSRELIGDKLVNRTDMDEREGEIQLLGEQPNASPLRRGQAVKSLTNPLGKLGK